LWSHACQLEIEVRRFSHAHDGQAVEVRIVGDVLKDGQSAATRNRQL
jgi:hypothetical protein